MQYPTASNAGFEIAPEPRDAEIGKTLNLRDIWAAVYRSRIWIALIMGACIAVAVTYSLLATRMYDSKVSIEIRQEAEKVLGTEADIEGGSAKNDTDRFLQTQLEIIKSRGTAQAVAESLGLYRGDAFLTAMKVEPAEGGTSSQSIQQIHRNQVDGALTGHVDVEYKGSTRIAELTFSSPDPQLSARIANAYADSFIRENLSRKFDSSAYALDFLRNQLAEAQQRLERAERQALAYARQLRLVDPSNATSSAAGAPQSLLAGQLVQLNQTYATAVADRIAAEQKWQRTQALPDLQIQEVLANAAVQGLLQQRAQASATYRQQLSTRRQDYPTVLEAAAQNRELDRQIATIARDVRRTVRGQYDVALDRERTLAEQIERLKGSALDEQSKTIQLSILRREADTSRQQYDALLRRYNSLNAEAGVQTNNLGIVDRADINGRPSWPRLSIILAIALFVGALLSFACVVLREQLFDAVRVPDDITNRLRVPFLGSIPDVDDVMQDIADPKSPVTEAFNSVRTALTLTEGGMPRTIVFTSSQAGEGKSSSCYALALSLARLERRVIIVDADLRRPNAHRLFGVKNDRGLTNVLAGLAPLASAIRSSPGGVDLLSSGDIPPNPSELINSAQFLALIGDLAERYDSVLIDSAPVLGIADAVILASEVDATVFIIEAGRNSIRGATNAITRLRQSSNNLAGALLTKYDPGRLGYGYSNDYSYEYRYQQ